jgi:hypothetical protein
VFFFAEKQVYQARRCKFVAVKFNEKIAGCGNLWQRKQQLAKGSKIRYLNVPELNK